MLDYKYNLDIYLLCLYKSYYSYFLIAKRDLAATNIVRLD